MEEEVFVELLLSGVSEGAAAAEPTGGAGKPERGMNGVRDWDPAGTRLMMMSHIGRKEREREKERA